MPLRAGLPPLIPGIKTNPGRKDDPNSADADDAFARVRRNVLTRDSYTCQYCGFCSPPDRREAAARARLSSGYMEVHHLDGDHGNNDEGNLVTVCPFCHLVFHVGFHGHQGTASIIWCPWLTQEELNLICNCAAVAVHRKGGDISPAAQALLSALASLTAPASTIDKFGAVAHDPAALGTALGVLAKADKKLFAKRAGALAEIRVLPTTAHFHKAVAFWSDHRWIPNPKWEEGWKRIHSDWEDRP